MCGLWLVNYFTVLFLTEIFIDFFVEKPSNVFFVVQDEDCAESENSLQCKVNSLGEGNNSYHWDDCRNDTSCGTPLTDNLAVLNDAYHLAYYEENGLVNYNLVVKDVTFSSAGAYQCRLHRNSKHQEAKGRMLVIGEFKLKCNWNIHNVIQHRFHILLTNYRQT